MLLVPLDSKLYEDEVHLFITHSNMLFLALSHLFNYHILKNIAQELNKIQKYHKVALTRNCPCIQQHSIYPLTRVLLRKKELPLFSKIL